MIEIIPAVLEETFEGVEHRLSQTRGLVKTAQIDVCDGVFVPSVTWPLLTPYQEGKTPNYEDTFRQIVKEEREMPLWESFSFELDLMISDAKRMLPDLLTMGPSRILFHYEALTNPKEDLKEFKAIIPSMVEIGIAMNAGTDPKEMFPLIDEGLVSSVQCMGIPKIGYQGQPFDERVLSNLRVLREAYPDLPLGVDGAVTLDTAKRLVDAGATRLASGSGIFKAEDVEGRIKEFQSLV